jgi:hypothetical protein
MSESLNSGIQPELSGNQGELGGACACGGPGDFASARVVAMQQLLFPPSPRLICDELGLNWWAAVKLFEDGWLSFPPEHTHHLDEAQEAELRFVGALVLAGCDRPMVAKLLRGLPRPYAYDLRRIYFDWLEGCWQLIPEALESSETRFAGWIEAMVQRGDIAHLAGIIELAQDAVGRIRSSSRQPEL